VDVLGKDSCEQGLKNNTALKNSKHTMSCVLTTESFEGGNKLADPPNPPPMAALLALVATLLVRVEG
jgi:hypothetical protein